jgi:hypothetical protein
MESTNRKNSNKSLVYIIPLSILIGIVPLICRAKEYKTGYSGFYWFLAADTNYDIFLYYKQLTIILMIIVMLLMMAYSFTIGNNRVKFPVFYMHFIGIYAILALLSTVFSKYNYWGFRGAGEQFESVWVLMGYALVIYYCYFFINSEKAIKMIIYSFIFSSIAVSGIGTFQYMGYDIFNSQFFLKLINPGNYDLGISSSGIYSTLYNSNYFGSYAALVVPVIFYMFMYESDITMRIIYLIDLLLTCISLYGSESATGMIAVIAEMFFSLFFMWRLYRKRIEITITIAVIAFCALVFLFASGKIKVISNNFYNGTNVDTSADNYPLKEIKVSKDGVSINYNNSVSDVFLGVNGEQAYFFNKAQDGNINTLEYDASAGGFVLGNMCIVPVSKDNNYYAFYINIDGHKWWFASDKACENYYYINAYDESYYGAAIDFSLLNPTQIGKFAPIENVEKAVFNNNLMLMSHRGYIWATTIPLIKKYIFLGSGADSFVCVYPHNDYVTLSNIGLSNMQITTKPHDLYLQIAVQTGLVSLIMFLLFYMCYFVQSVIIYFKCRYDDYKSVVGGAIFIATAGYMISGLTNDSIIAVSPIYWTLLGTGIAINALLWKKRKHAKIEKEKIDNNLKEV